MSFAEIIAEIPKLTREEREAILGRIADLDQGLWVDVSVSADERKEIDWRLAEAKAGGVSWSAWDDAKTKITKQLES